MGKRWTTEMTKYAKENRDKNAKELAAQFGVSIETVYNHVSFKNRQFEKSFERPKAEYSNRGYLYLINNV